MKKIVIVVCFILMVFNISIADESIFSIGTNTAVKGEKYLLIVFDGNLKTPSTAEFSEDIRYISQQTAHSSQLLFTGIKLINTEVVTAFLINERGNIVKTEQWITDNAYVTCQIVLPSSTMLIDEEAFYGGTFESIYIPASVTRIEAKAFANCSKLKKIVFENGNITVANDFIENCSSGLTIIAPVGSTVYNNIDVYKSFCCSTPTNPDRDEEVPTNAADVSTVVIHPDAADTGASEFVDEDE